MSPWHPSCISAATSASHSQAVSFKRIPRLSSRCARPFTERLGATTAPTSSRGPRSKTAAGSAQRLPRRISDWAPAPKDTPRAIYFPENPSQCARNVLIPCARNRRETPPRMCLLLELDFLGINLLGMVSILQSLDVPNKSAFPSWRFAWRNRPRLPGKLRYQSGRGRQADNNILQFQSGRYTLP